jgi:hypothetical protein
MRMEQRAVARALRVEGKPDLGRADFDNIRLAAVPG